MLNFALMKRIFTFLLGLVLCLSAMAQAQITTKKEKLSDFDSKTMKVVLTGSPFLDESLREALHRRRIRTAQDQ